MERYCSTRLLKNARFLQGLEVRYLPQLEPIDGFSSLVPFEILGRMHQTPPEEIGIEQLAQVVRRKRPPRPKPKPVVPLFSGTLRFVRMTFSSGGKTFAVPDVDLNIAMQYTGLVIAPISQYASQYGPNKLQLASTTIPFNAPVTNGKYNDSILSGWVDRLAKANGFGSDSCPMFLNPQGVVNTDADPKQGVGGYHNISSSGVPYAFVNVMGHGLTVDDKQDVYAVALSHEIAEMTVDPKANGSNPEVCDSCLPPDEILLGDNNAISDYVVGSMVTGQNGLQDVTGKFVRPYEGELLEIKAVGMLPFRVTPNHPLMVVRGQNTRLSIRYSPPEWKEAGAVMPKVRGHDGDYLVMPRIPGTRNDDTIDLRQYVEKHQASLKQSGRGAKPRSYPHFKSLPLTEDVAWMFGVYVAEGYPNVSHRSIEFALNSNETSVVEQLRATVELLGLHLYTEPIAGEEGIKAIVCSIILAKSMPELCGKGAENKRIPDVILFHSDERIIRAFLRGYHTGDGSKKNTISGYEISSFSTVSRILALQLQLLYGRLGIFISLRKEREKRTGFIDGRTVEMKESFVGSWCSDARATRNKRLHEGGINAFYLPVKGITKHPYCGLVHNLETVDHTFLVSNLVVHNCAGNCSVDFRNYFDAKGSWLGGTATPGYSFFIDGIATPATVAQCPAPKGSCSYPPPKSTTSIGVGI